MAGLPYDPGTGRVKCPRCGLWVNTFNCQEQIDLLGAGPTPCGAAICPNCNVPISPDHCPNNRPDCPYK
jgi:hypothetical protein